MAGTAPARVVLAVLLFACVAVCASEPSHSLQSNGRVYLQGRKLLQPDRLLDGAHLGFVRGRGRDVRLAKKPDANMMKLQVAADQAGGAVDLSGVGLGMKNRLARYQERAAQRRDAADAADGISSGDEGPHQVDTAAVKEDDLVALDKDQDVDDGAAVAVTHTTAAPVATTTDLATTRPPIAPVQVGTIAQDGDAGASELTALDHDHTSDEATALPDAAATAATTTPHASANADDVAGAVASPPATTTFTQRFETATSDPGTEQPHTTSEAAAATSPAAQSQALPAEQRHGMGEDNAAANGAAANASQRDEEHEERFDEEATLTASQRNTGDPDARSEERFDAAATLPAAQRAAADAAGGGADGSLPGIPLRTETSPAKPAQPDPIVSQPTTTTTTHASDPAALREGADARSPDDTLMTQTGSAADSAVVIGDLVVQPSELASLQDGTTEGADTTLQRRQEERSAPLDVTVTDEPAGLPAATLSLQRGAAAGSDVVVQPASVPSAQRADGVAMAATHASAGAVGDADISVDASGNVDGDGEEGVMPLESQLRAERGAGTQQDVETHASSAEINNARNALTGIDALSASLPQPQGAIAVQPLPESSFLPRSEASRERDGADRKPQVAEDALRADASAADTASFVAARDASTGVNVFAKTDVSAAGANAQPSGEGVVGSQEGRQLVHDSAALVNGMASTDEELDAAPASNVVSLVDDTASADADSDAT